MVQLVHCFAALLSVAMSAVSLETFERCLDIFEDKDWDTLKTMAETASIEERTQFLWCAVLNQKWQHAVGLLVVLGADISKECDYVSIGTSKCDWLCFI